MAFGDLAGIVHEEPCLTHRFPAEQGAFLERNAVIAEAERKTTAVSEIVQALDQKSGAGLTALPRAVRLNHLGKLGI